MTDPGHRAIGRREAIRRIAALTGGALYAPTLSGLLAGCEAPPSGVSYAPRSLTRSQMARVETLAEIIIPETDTPGASAARVHDFVDMMLTDFFAEEQRARFLEGLEHVDAASVSVVGVSFEDATPEQQRLVIAALDEEAYSESATATAEPAFFRTMKELTVSGYYTSEIGQTVELHVPPFAEYRADVPFDEIGKSWA